MAKFIGSSRQANTINGGVEDDTIEGGIFADILYGGDGNDYVEGAQGNDALYGGAGNDTLLAVRGDVITVDGGDGYDVLRVKLDFMKFQSTFTLDGNTLRLEPTNTTYNLKDVERVEFKDVAFELGAARGSAQWTGSALDEMITGDEAGNRIAAGAGRDWIYGHGGDDTLRGDAGDDALFGGSGWDVAAFAGAREDYEFSYSASGDSWTVKDTRGASGTDTLYGIEALGFGDGSTLSLSALTRGQVISGKRTADGTANADTVTGTDLGDTLNGSAGYDRLFGGGERDHLDGGADADMLYGDDGADRLYGGAGDDRLYGGDGDDSIYGEAGSSLIDGGDGDDRIVAGADYDIVQGGAGRDTIYGLAEADFLRGDEDDDVLFGGAGFDVLFGGQGNDSLYGGTGADYFCFEKGSGVDIIYDFSSAAGDKISVDGRGMSFADIKIYSAAQAPVGYDGERSAGLVVDMGSGDWLFLKGLKTLAASDFSF